MSIYLLDTTTSVLISSIKLSSELFFSLLGVGLPKWPPDNGLGPPAAVVSPRGAPRGLLGPTRKLEYSIGLTHTLQKHSYESARPWRTLERTRHLYAAQRHGLHGSTNNNNSNIIIVAAEVVQRPKRKRPRRDWLYISSQIYTPRAVSAGFIPLRGFPGRFV